MKKEMELYNRLLQLLYKKEYSLEDIRFFIGCLFVFSLPFERFFSEICLILLLILAVMDISFEKIKSIPKSIWAFQLVFFLTILSLIYTDKAYLSEAGFQIEKQLALLLFPLLIPISFKLTSNRIDYFLKTLTIACILSFLYLLIANYFFYTGMGYSLIQLLQSNIWFNHAFTAPLNIHASYYATFTCLSAFYVLSKYREKRKLIFSLILFLFSFSLIILSARAIFIAFVLVLAFVYPLFYARKLKKYFLLIGLSACFLLLIFKTSPYIQNRFGKDLLSDLGAENSKDNPEPRITRWEASFNVIEKSPIIGHGTGSEVILLKKEYWKEGLILSFYKNFNVHNQFLSITIKHGLVGLLLFILSLIYFFRIAIRNKSFIYISFLILSISFFMVENVLDSNKGIFFYAFFNTLFGYYYLYQEKEKNFL